MRAIGDDEVAEFFAQHDDARGSRPLAYYLNNGLVLAIFAVLGALPSVQRALGITFESMLLAVLAMAFGVGVASVVRALSGPRSRAFLVAHAVEFGVLAGAPLVLIAISHHALSVFWFWFVGIVLINAAFLGWARVHIPITLGCPAALAVWFTRRGEVGDAAIALIAGLTTFAVYRMMVHQARRSARLALERAVLEKELAARDKEDERRRIARDLHDGVGADLTALLWRIRDLSTNVGDERRADVDALVRVASDALDEIRVVATGLRTTYPSWQRFVEELRLRGSLLCGSMLAFDVTADLPLEARPPPRIAVELPRIVLEAVRNAATHAGCATITVRLRRVDDMLVVTIDDDGIGLADGELAASRGGLANLEHRAKDLGGSFVASTKSRGTSLTLTVPCAWDGEDRGDA